MNVYLYATRKDDGRFIDTPFHRLREPVTSETAPATTMCGIAVSVEWDRWTLDPSWRPAMSDGSEPDDDMMCKACEATFSQPSNTSGR